MSRQWPPSNSGGGGGPPPIPNRGSAGGPGRPPSAGRPPSRPASGGPPPPRPASGGRPPSTGEHISNVSSGAKALVYALIARGPTVLADNSCSDYGNFVPISRKILEKLVASLPSPFTTEQRMSYQYDRFAFHILCVPMVPAGQPLVFLCMADESFPRRIVYKFHEDVVGRFRNTFPMQQLSRAVAYGMNSAFQPVLRQQMERYARDPEADKLAHVRRQVDETREIMVDNIDKLLERGDKIDLLVDQTDGLQQTSLHFKKESKRLEWAMFIKNVKLIIGLAILATIALAIALLMTCGITLSCLKF